MKQITILSFVLFPFLLFGQLENDSLLTSFYNQTISSYFSNPDIKNKSQHDLILIQTDLESPQLIKEIKSYKFKYFNSKKKTLSLLEKPLKNHTGRIIYVIKHDFSSQDTIYINITASKIIKLSKRETIIKTYKIEGEMILYQSKFIYDKISKSWINTP